MDDREEAPHPLIPIPAGPRRSLAERLRGADSYGLLLILVLLSLLITALVSDRNWGRVVITAVTGATTLFAFWTSRPSVAVLRVVTVVVMLGVVAAIAASVGSSTPLDNVGRAGLALIAAASPITVARRLLRHPRIQGSTVLGALCIYLLLGQFFAYLYSTIGALDKPFFVQQPNATLVDYLYFSYTTQTTVGYGDLTAAQDLGRMLAVSEALTGQLYLVTVIALLVSNLGRSRAR
jgi:Ion channel